MRFKQQRVISNLDAEKNFVQAETEFDSIASEQAAQQAEIDALQVAPPAHAASHLPGGSDALTTAAAGTISPGDTASAGSATSFARSDHRHAIAAAVAGSIQPDDAAAEGVATSFSRSDHKHSIVAATAGAIQPDDTAAEGSATSFARSDHRHAIAAATASTISGTNAEGSSSSFARADHNHALPDFGTFYASPYMSAPTSAAVVANRTYFTQVQVLTACTLTGIEFFPLSATGTARVSLYDSSGARVANRTTDSAALAIAVTQIAFNSPSGYAAAPGLYYAAITFSGTPNVTQAAHFRANFTAGPGSNATATSITAPTGATTVPTMSTY